jgi:hypothetical protein
MASRHVDLNKFFAANGFVMIRSRKHEIWRCPCGHTQIVSSCTRQGGRGDMNCKSRIARVLRECGTRQPAQEAS